MHRYSDLGYRSHQISLAQEGESLAGESLAGRSAAGTHYSRASRADSRLDRDLQDAIEMVKVSDTKIGALRKMHAQYLLRRWASAAWLHAARPRQLITLCVGPLK